MGDKTSIVLEKISLRILDAIKEISPLQALSMEEYCEGYVDGLSKALQIVNGGKQDD